MRNQYDRLNGWAPSLALALALALGGLPLGADDLTYHEIGARAASLGGAFTARANDATAVHYNPAGLAFLDGLRFKANAVFGRPSFNAYWPAGDRTFTSHPSSFLMNAFLSWQPVRRVSFGLGYYSPYNSRMLWDHPLWAVPEVTISTELDARTVRAALAVEVVKGLAVGVALDYLSTSVYWNNYVPFTMANYEVPPETLVDARHYLSGHGWGLTASALWRVFPALQIGVRYQKSVPVDLKGANQFNLLWDHAQGYVPDPYWPVRPLYEVLQMFFVPQTVTGKVTLPQEVAVGVVLAPVPRLSLHFDVLWDKWSEFGRWEFRSTNTDEDLAPDFTPLYQEFWGVRPNYGTLGAPLALRDSRKFKAGAEYQLGQSFSVRAGFARYESSVETSELSPVYPDLARKIYSFGVSYEGPFFSFYDGDRPIGSLSLDLFIRHASTDPAASTLAGLEMSYSSKGSWSAGLGVGFFF